MNIKELHFDLSAANIAMVLTGTILMTAGLYRIVPVVPIKKILYSNAPLGIMLVIFAYIMWNTYQKGGIATAIGVASMQAYRFVPLVLILCLVMGIGAVLTTWHEKVIMAFIIRHDIIGPPVAALLTPASNAIVATVESAWRNILTSRPGCLYYLQASAMMSIPLFMMRSLGFSKGSVMPLRMYVTGLIVSLVMLPLSKPLFIVVEFIVSNYEKWRGLTPTG